MTATGTVLSTDNGTAVVKVFRESPCAACKGCAEGICHAELTFDSEPNAIQVTAKDACGVHVGDVVELYSNNRFTLGLAVMLFGLPFVFAAAFGVVAGIFYPYAVAVGMAILAFVLSFLSLAFLADRICAKITKTVITKIIKESGGMPPKTVCI